LTQTRSEILEQPEVLARVIGANEEVARNCAASIRWANVKFVLIAARGTSDHAATYAKYLWGAYNHLPVALAAPSLHTIYHSAPNLEGALVVGISQSGASTDIVTVVQQAREQGAQTLAITNRVDSPLAQTAQFVLPLLAGEEKAVAATKTYTAELACVALLSATLSNDKERLDQLERVPEAVAQALRVENLAKEYAERYRYMQYGVVLSRGFNLATASEIALKIKEMSYSHMQPYSTADFMHGPLASVYEGFPVIAVAPRGVLYPNLLQSLNQVKERQAEMLVISDGDEALSLGHLPLRVPSVPEWLSPIVDVIPGQWLALHLALARGYQPDTPRALHKVTLTV